MDVCDKEGDMMAPRGGSNVADELKREIGEWSGKNQPRQIVLYMRGDRPM